MKKIIFLLTVLSVFIACKEQSQDQANSKNLTKSEIVSVKTFNKLDQKLGSQLQIIDIRTNDEVQDGMIPNAIHIDFYASDFKIQMDKLDKNKATLVYCQSGIRSNKSMQILDELQFKEAYDLQGGYMSYLEYSNSKN